MTLPEISERSSEAMLALETDEEYDTYTELMDVLEYENIKIFDGATPESMTEKYGMPIDQKCFDALFWFVAEMNAFDEITALYESLPEDENEDK